MNEFINKTPFLRLTLPLCFGIICSILSRLYADKMMLLLSGYLALVLVYFLLYRNTTTFLKWCFGLGLNFLLFVVGVEACSINLSTNREDHYSKFITGENVNYIAFVSEIPLEKEKVVSSKLELIGQGTGNNYKTVSGEVLVYFEKDSCYPKYGDEIVFQSTPQLIDGPKNPGEFDYRNYLFFKNISHQFYLKKDQFVVTGKNSSNPIMNYANNLRLELLSILSSNGLKDDEFGIAAALLIGFDDTISSDLMSSYSRTGTLHVLSVSGMHVGILFLALNFLLRFPERKFYKALKTLLILIVLWFYAMLSGLSPSVVRSTIMFSFVLFGVLINKKGQIYNTIFASAFIMLLFDPFLIVDAGFQLSYLAVVGIVFFYPYIINWYLPKNYLTSVIWKMFAVSLSAQIITLPITLYYFHQFPILFFIANLVVIPVSYIIMFGSLLIVVFAKIKVIAVAIAFVVGKSVAFMNWFTVLLDQFEYSNISGINTGFIELILLFVLIISATYALINKSYVSVIATFLTVVLLLIGGIVSDEHFNKQKRLVFYAFKNSFGIHMIEGKSSLLIADSLSKRSESIIDNYSMLSGVESASKLKALSGIYLFEFNGEKVMLINGDTLSNYDLSNVVTDYICISNNPRLKGIDKFNAKKIIVDGTNTNSTVTYLKKKFENNGLGKLWFLKEKGAFITD